jgi:hypothetical protein
MKQKYIVISNFSSKLLFDFIMSFFFMCQNYSMFPSIQLILSCCSSIHHVGHWHWHFFRLFDKDNTIMPLTIVLNLKLVWFTQHLTTLIFPPNNNECAYEMHWPWNKWKSSKTSFNKMHNQITTWNLLKTKERKCQNPCLFSTFLVSMFWPTKYKH